MINLEIDDSGIRSLHPGDVKALQRDKKLLVDLVKKLAPPDANVAIAFISDGDYFESFEHTLRFGVRVGNSFKPIGDRQVHYSENMMAMLNYHE